MDNLKIKSCPFCGLPALLEIDNDHHGDFHSLGCSDKKCIGHHVIYTEGDKTVQESVKTWNTRSLK